jgi:hypothetical protein
MMKAKVGIDVQWQENHCQILCFLCAHLVSPTCSLPSFLPFATGCKQDIMNSIRPLG